MRTSSRLLLPVALVTILPALAHAAPASRAATDVLENGLLLGFLAAFGWGVMTSLTPCVYPMIPIIVAVFGARDESVTRGKAMVLATAFVLGIATLYTALGVGFALLGKQSNQLLSNAYVIVPIAVVLLALAASMFGAFEIRLPHAVQQRLNRVGGKGTGGAYLLGLVLGIIAAPCTGAFAAGIIVMVAKTQNVVLGGGLMFTYALGLGVLFWVLAVFSLALPKSGGWMETIKGVGGVVLIVMAAYFLIPIVPAIGRLGQPGLGFLAGALVVAALGFAIGAAHLSFHGSAAERARKALGVVLAIAGLLAAVNGYLAPDHQLAWRHDEATAFADARRDGKHVLVDFGATWCLPCKEVTKILGDEAMFDVIDRSFVPLKFDVSEQTDRDERLQAKYDAPVLPAVIFLDADGHELGRYTNKSPSLDSFRATLRDVLARHPR